ncbi:MAG: ankyrin repeat domain-containing protein [Planctomycetota bacterium]
MAQRREKYGDPIEDLPFADRRGAWDSGGNRWEARLIEGGPDAIADALEKAEGVGGVIRDVTQDALNGTLVMPDGRWALLVKLAGTPWVHALAAEGPFARDMDFGQRLSKLTGRRTVVTGHEKTSGVTYVSTYEAGERKMDFGSMGLDFQDPNFESDDPCEMATYVEGTDHGQDWLKTFKNENEVVDALLTELHAYVPGIEVYRGVEEGKLQIDSAHPDAVNHVERVDLLIFGDAKNAQPNPASKQLVDAIQAGDPVGVASALTAGASLNALPNVRVSALNLAIGAYQVADSVKLAIVDYLLAAGADPSDGGSKQEPPIHKAASQCENHPQLAVQLVERLIDAGADPEATAISFPAFGQTVLRSAARVGQLPIVQLLNDRDCDMQSRDDQGRTALDHARDGYASCVEAMGEDEAATRFANIRETIAYLEAVAAGQPLDRWSNALADSEHQATRKRREMRQKFAGVQDAMRQLDEAEQAEREADVPEEAGVDAIASAVTAKVPDGLMLVPIDDDTGWENVVRREQMAGALENAGFKRIGRFRVDGMFKPVFLLAFVSESESLYVTINTQRLQGVWVDIVRMHADGGTLTYTNHGFPAASDLPKFRKVREPKWGVNKLISGIREETKPEGGLASVGADRFVEDVQRAVAAETAEAKQDMGNIVGDMLRKLTGGD